MEERTKFLGNYSIKISELIRAKAKPSFEELELEMKKNLQPKIYQACKLLGSEKAKLLEPCVREICEASIRCSNMKSAFNQTLSSLHTTLYQGGEPSMMMASQMFQSTLASTPVVSVDAHDFYKKFSKSASKQEDADDVQAMDESGEQRLKDPLTMGMMKEPMRNELCGHVYDVSTMQKLMGKSCPLRGCDKVIKMEHMTEDTERASEIMEHHRKLQKKTKQPTAAPPPTTAQKKKSRLAEED